MADIIDFPLIRVDQHFETVERHGQVGALIFATACDRNDDALRYLVLHGGGVGFEILMHVSTDHDGALDYLRETGKAVLRTLELAVVEFSPPAA